MGRQALIGVNDPHRLRAYCTGGQCCGHSLRDIDFAHHAKPRGETASVTANDNAPPLQLSERADGALALRYVESTAGVMAIAPFYDSSSRWMRFGAAPKHR